MAGAVFSASRVIDWQPKSPAVRARVKVFHRYYTPVNL